MSVTPVNITRVSQNFRYDALLAASRRTSLELLLQQQRLSSGRAFISASEDPIAASEAFKLHESLDQQGQIATNAQHASNVLDASDAALSDVSGLLNDAQGLAIRSAGSLTSPAERSAAAEEVASIIRQLTNVGNRQFGKLFLFAGRDTTAAPFVSALGGVAYHGDTGDVLARVNLLDQQAINLPGNMLFGALSGTQASTVDLSPALTATTRLEDLRTADGQTVPLVPVVITDTGSGATFSVDLSQAGTIDDVIDRINSAAQAAGSSLTASLSGNQIQLSGPASVGSSLLIGPMLQRVVSATTPIADLAGGTGVNLTAPIVITNGGTSATVDLSAAQTVQDILNALNSAGVEVRAQINAAGTGIEVLNQVSGTLLSIGEQGGTTATNLGIRTLDLTTPLSQLNFGAGVQTVSGTDFRITAANGSVLDVDVDPALTVGDVITQINTAAGAAGVAVQASLADAGGIRLVDSTGGSGTLAVSRLNGSFAADDLGLAPPASASSTELIGTDPGAVRANGVLTALVDLERALRRDDTPGITDAGQRLTAGIDDLNRVHGEIGARAQAMQTNLTQVQDAVVSTRSFLSQVEDVDYTEAVTRFQQAQTALQSILLTGARMLNISLLDFLG
ncbi:MAG TPA: flagellin [Phycisphaerae bacterium]